MLQGLTTQCALVAFTTEELQLSAHYTCTRPEYATIIVQPLCQCVLTVMAVGYHRIKKIQFVALREAKYVNHSDCADQYGDYQPTTVMPKGKNNNLYGSLIMMISKCINETHFRK